MSHWNCFVAGCTNSHYTQKSNPNLTYYRIPKKHIDYYNAFFKTDDIAWDFARICSAHWSQPRRNCNHLPDIRLVRAPKPHRQQTPYHRAAKRNRALNKHVGKVIKQVDSVSNESARKDTEIEQLKEELLRVKEENKQLSEENSVLKTKTENLSVALGDAERTLSQARSTITFLKDKTDQGKKFSWEDVDSTTFQFLTGLSVVDFATLFDLFKPFLHLLKYEGCRLSSSTHRKVSKENELFCVLLMLRHGVEEGLLAWIVDVSPSTMSRIFVAWITFGSAVFSKISLDHRKELILKKLPRTFKDNGYEHCVLILDATEFKLTSLSDLKLNCLFFSDYKNTHTAKGLIGITPHGSLCHVADLYPGSVTDTELTQITCALKNVKENDCVMVDKGFAISEQAADLGGIVNRPPMANVEQFTPGEVEANFKIAALRIHVERWIGRLRNFSILNKVWHTSRLDLLNETFKFVAHLVNLLDVVGPKE